MACSRRWRAGRIERVRRAFPADCFPRPRGGVSLFFSREKKSNQKKRAARARAGAAHRCPVLLGESGDGAELATLKHRRLFAPDSPAMLGSLKADPTSRATAAPSRSTPCVDAVDLDLPVRLERAEHRRSGGGEEVRVSERSEFPRRPSTDRGAQGTGVQSTPARGRRSVSLVTFLMAHIHVRHPTGRLRRSTLLLQRGARAKKVTPLRGRGNDPPGSARRYQCVGARPYNHPFCRANRYASIRLATPSLPMHSDR